ncbi:MAG: phosphatidylglycerophosphatase A [Verrucomicrobiota bacterium]|nr:phosphatidylglycerophosphatase A [Verrucomicrobiota bacterium]
MARFILLLARGGGLGLAPKAPGTIGTLGGYPLTLLFLAPGSFWVYLAACVLLVPLSVWICGEAERILEREDPGEVVFDEIIAVPICYLGVFGLMAFQGEGMPDLSSLFGYKLWWVWALAGFGLFRLFDIWKPGPIEKSQSFRGGWGVTMDDVLAGLFTGVILAGVYSSLQ